ncbi:hypothetical protein J4482_00410 [Candidatus Woesearchaeota archaeon]|nr:hypothetical protein [Candidatus Woesearchaeota archaeon]
MERNTQATLDLIVAGATAALGAVISGTAGSEVLSKLKKVYEIGIDKLDISRLQDTALSLGITGVLGALTFYMAYEAARLWKERKGYNTK